MFDHKRALRALLDGDERQGIIAANVIVNSLPDELGFADMSSDDVAANLLEALAPRTSEESVGE